jgi:hypothetical protein
MMPRTPCFAQEMQIQPFVLQDKLVRVDALVNGRPVHAVLDSGVSNLALSPQTSAALALTSSDEVVEVARACKAPCDS